MCVEQLDAMLADSVEGSAFYRPITKFPTAFPAADQARLKAAYAQAISAKMRPALTRHARFHPRPTTCPRPATASACRT